MMSNNKFREIQRASMTVIIFFVIWLFCGSVTVYAAEDDSVQLCRQELLDMMRNMDSSWHEVSEYSFNAMDINEIWWDLIEEEGYLDYSSYDLIYVTFKISNGLVTHMALVGLDDEYPLRYASILNHINVVKEATQSMNDMEKVLFVYEYINDITYYTYVSDHEKYRACGPLYNGYAVCEGYAEAVRLLLRQINIPVTYVSSAAINHGWNYVQVDGEWYHIDSTWDDDKEQTGINRKHTYFIRNDSEYLNDMPKKHYDWIVKKLDAESVSTKYTDWFVHDIKGKMYYYNGLWYYIDNNTGDIVCSEIDAEQSGYEVLVDKDINDISSLSITKVENDILYYTADGIACEKSLITDEEEISTGLDWSNASYWRTGHYELDTGIYGHNVARICLKDYIEIEPGNRYQVKISDSNLRILIREMTTDKEYVASWNLHGGGIFNTSADTRYLAISLYSPNSDMSYDEYESKFRNGMTVKVDYVGKMEIETIDWSNVKYWRNGYYSLEQGIYIACQSKICLRDYIVVSPKKSYKVIISEDSYKMEICELTKDKMYIKTHNLKDGDMLEIADNTYYLSVCIYIENDQFGYARNYINDIANGMNVGLIENNEEVDVNSTFFWNDEKYWRKGCYSVVNGIYEYCEDRICLVDYVLLDNTKKYKIEFQDRRYHMLIREMDDDKMFINTYNLVSGEVFLPSEDTIYIGVSLYLPEKGTNAVYSDYVDVIEAGVGFQVTDATASISVLGIENEYESETDVVHEISEESTEELSDEISEEEIEEKSSDEISEEEIEEKSSDKIGNGEIVEEETSGQINEEEMTDESILENITEIATEMGGEIENKIG